MNDRLVIKRHRQRLLTRLLVFDGKQAMDSIRSNSLIAARNINRGSDKNSNFKLLPAQVSDEQQMETNQAEQQTDSNSNHSISGLMQRLMGSECLSMRQERIERLRRNKRQDNNLVSSSSSNISDKINQKKKRQRVENLNPSDSIKLKQLMIFICLLISLAASSTNAVNNGVSNKKQADLALDQHQLLLKSANVELNRSLRLQRDILPSSTSASSNSNNELAGPPTCGYPGSPAHASVTFNTSHVTAGTAASYTCDNGYELLGPPRRICQANGTWSPIGIPFCGK